VRLVVAAIGRLKDGPERELAERYRKRAEQTGRRIGFRDTEVLEIRESRAQEVGKRMIEESIALANIIPDPNILGVFFWGWDDTGSFSLKGLQAASVVHTHYSSLQA